jgi:hypothetical protein
MTVRPRVKQASWVPRSAGCHGVNTGNPDPLDRVARLNGDGVGGVCQEVTRSNLNHRRRRASDLENKDERKSQEAASHRARRWYFHNGALWLSCTRNGVDIFLVTADYPPSPWTGSAVASADDTDQNRSPSRTEAGIQNGFLDRVTLPGAAFPALCVLRSASMKKESGASAKRIVSRFGSSVTAPASLSRFRSTSIVAVPRATISFSTVSVRVAGLCSLNRAAKLSELLLKSKSNGSMKPVRVDLNFLMNSILWTGKPLGFIPSVESMLNDSSDVRRANACHTLFASQA